MRRYYEAFAPPSHMSMINLSPMHCSAPSPHRVPCCAEKDTPSVCQHTIKLSPTDNPTKRKPSKSQTRPKLGRTERISKGSQHP